MTCIVEDWFKITIKDWGTNVFVSKVWRLKCSWDIKLGTNDSIPFNSFLLTLHHKLWEELIISTLIKLCKVTNFTNLTLFCTRSLIELWSSPALGGGGPSPHKKQLLDWFFPFLSCNLFYFVINNETFTKHVNVIKDSRKNLHFVLPFK